MGGLAELCWMIVLIVAAAAAIILICMGMWMVGINFCCWLKTNTNINIDKWPWVGRN